MSTNYLLPFQKALTQLDTAFLDKKQLQAAAGFYKEDSAFLKLYKNSWANEGEDALTAETKIFFSVWVNKNLFKQKRLMYNIHALKLRNLKNYRITSRKFAEEFRNKFKQFEAEFPNVSTAFGPLTLMEGWMQITADPLEDQIAMIAKKFFLIDHLIDDLLVKYKK